MTIDITAEVAHARFQLWEVTGLIPNTGGSAQYEAHDYFPHEYAKQDNTTEEIQFIIMTFVEDRVKGTTTALLFFLFRHTILATL